MNQPLSITRGITRSIGISKKKRYFPNSKEMLLLAACGELPDADRVIAAGAGKAQAVAAKSQAEDGLHVAFEQAIFFGRVGIPEDQALVAAARECHVVRTKGDSEEAALRPGAEGLLEVRLCQIPEANRTVLAATGEPPGVAVERTLSTSPWCPLKCAGLRRWQLPQTLTVRSQLALAKCLPSRLKATPCTKWLCSRRTRFSLPLARSQILTVWS